MFRITLVCEGVPVDAGEIGAIDIRAEFDHRPWQRNVACTWDGKRLILEAENDVDSDGQALMDELSDAITACIAEPFDGEISVKKVVEIDANAT